MRRSETKIFMNNYCSHEARESLLLSGVTVNNPFVELYAKNPYDGDCETERLIIKDLPLCESNALVSDFFKSQPHVIICANIIFMIALYFHLLLINSFVFLPCLDTIVCRFIEYTFYDQYAPCCVLLLLLYP